MIKMIMRYFSVDSMKVYNMTEDEAKTIQKFLNIQADDDCTIENILENDELYFEFTDEVVGITF